MGVADRYADIYVLISDTSNVKNFPQYHHV
jgi:hypothetical protein